MASRNAHVGGIGEAFIRQLCHEAQITPNAVQFDDKGWDAFLQFPQEGASCLVQVKATQGGKRMNVARKAWRHLAAIPLPAFFFIVNLGPDMKPQRGYLVHVDEPMMTDVLSRDERGSKVLTWSEQHALPSLSGEALKSAILDHVGSDFVKYSSRKVAYLGQHRSSEVKITFPEMKREELAEVLSNFAIGVGGPLRVQHFDHVPIEFGRRGERERHDDATVEGQPPSVCEAKVTVRNVVTGERVAFRAKTYSAVAVFPWLPPEFRKMRFVADFLSITLTPGQQPGRVRVTWNFKIGMDPIRLADAVEIAKAVRMLIGAKDGELRTAFEMETNGSPNSTGEMPVLSTSVDRGEETLELTRAIEQAWAIAVHFGLPPDTKVRAPDVLREAERLQLIYLPLIGHGDIQARVAVKWESNEKPPSTVAILTQQVTQLGEHVLAAVLAFRGSPRYVDDGGKEFLEVADPAPHFMKKVVLSRAEWRSFKFKPLVLEAKETLLKDGVDLVLMPSEPRKMRRRTNGGGRPSRRRA